MLKIEVKEWSELMCLRRRTSAELPWTRCEVWVFITEGFIETLNTCWGKFVTGTKLVG